METFQEWWIFAEKLGVAGTFILGIITFFLWKDNKSEREYLRVRDKETLSVISSLTSLLDKQAIADSFNTDRLVESMAAIAKDIERHDRSNSETSQRILQLLERYLERQG